MKSSQTFQFQVVRPKFTLPAWFAALAPNTWYPLAGGAGQLGDAWQKGSRPQDVTRPVAYLSNDLSDLSRNNNGAAISDTEMLLVNNGGHASGHAECDAWALDFSAEAPEWKLIADPPPLKDNPRFWDRDLDGNTERMLSSAGTGYTAPIYVPGHWYDGPIPAFPDNDPNIDVGSIRCRPRTVHSNNHAHYANGKVWWPILNAWNAGSGPTSLCKMSFDRAGLANGSVEKRYVSGSLGPWAYLGTISEVGGGVASVYDFGSAALDPETNTLWYVGQSAFSYWGMSTLDGTHTRFSRAERVKNPSNASALCRLPKAGGGFHTLWVHLVTESNALSIGDLSSTPHGWSLRPTNGAAFEWAASLRNVEPTWPLSAQGKGLPAAGWGMVWHAKSKAFLAYNCDQVPDQAVLRKLTPPLSGGVYDPSGAWVWSEVSLAAGQGKPDYCSRLRGGNGAGGGSYSRFNLIPNFGGSGADLLVHYSYFDKPTWVARLTGPL